METKLTLEKGNRVDLTKENPSLKVVAAGLGWDVTKAGSTHQFDLDAFALPLKEGKLTNAETLRGVVFFKNLEVSGIKHSGDNLTGEGSGDDETIFSQLDKLKADGITEVLFGANIYMAAERGKQNFGQVSNAFIRLYNAETKEQLCKYDLSEDFSSYTGVILGKLYLHVDSGEWKFQATGEGVNGDILSLATPYAQ